MAATTLNPSAGGTDERTHLASASASHYGAAASVLDQSALHRGSGSDQTAGGWSRRQALSTRVLVARMSARSLHPPLPRTVEQPKACSIWRSFMTALVQTKLQVPGRGRQTLSTRVLGCWRHRMMTSSTHTLDPPPPRTVEQPHACSFSRSIMVDSGADQTAGGRWLITVGSTLHPTAGSTDDEHTHRGSASASHR